MLNIGRQSRLRTDCELIVDCLSPWDAIHIEYPKNDEFNKHKIFNAKIQN